MSGAFVNVIVTSTVYFFIDLACCVAYVYISTRDVEHFGDKMAKVFYSKVDFSTTILMLLMSLFYPFYVGGEILTKTAQALLRGTCDFLILSSMLLYMRVILIRSEVLLQQY